MLDLSRHQRIGQDIPGLRQEGLRDAIADG
jgi:hypothetical protein